MLPGVEIASLSSSSPPFHSFFLQISLFIFVRIRIGILCGEFRDRVLARDYISCLIFLTKNQLNDFLKKIFN